MPHLSSVLSALSPLSRSVLEAMLLLAGAPKAMGSFPKPASLLRHCALLLPHLQRLTPHGPAPSNDAGAALDCIERLAPDGLDAVAGELLAAASSCEDQPSTMHGWRKLAPLLCAVATPLDNVCRDGQLTLLAAALVLAPGRDDETLYRIGLELRKLAEEPRTTAIAQVYRAPTDLLELTSADDVISRLPVAEDDSRDAALLFVSFDGMNREASLIALGRHLHAKVGLQRGRRVGGGGRARGPNHETGALRMTQKAIHALGGLVEPAEFDGTRHVSFRVHPACIAETEIDDELDLDLADVGHDGQGWATESMRVQILMDFDAPLPLRNRVLTEAMQWTPEDIAPEEHLWVVARRADPAVARRWWDGASAAPAAQRRSQQLGLVLTTVLGVALNTLDKMMLRDENDVRPGLRVWRRDGVVAAQLRVHAPQYHEPFPALLCDPQWLYRTEATMAFCVHPTVAAWLAVTLESAGLAWQARAGGDMLIGPIGDLKLRAALQQLARLMAKTDPGSRATVGHTSGLFMLALTQAGTRDPGLAYLVAPALRESPPTQAIYTNASAGAIVNIHLRTQMQAWSWLRGVGLATWTPEADPYARFGSARCATPEAVQAAHRLLQAKVTSARRLGLQGGLANHVNALSRLVLFRLIASRGLRARYHLWNDTSTLFNGSPCWTFNDKGKHCRSLPLDEVDHRDLIWLAATIKLTKARLPPEAAEAFAQMKASENLLCGVPVPGPAPCSLGHLEQVNGQWRWRALKVSDLRTALAAGGMNLSISSVRHAARSVLARDGHPPMSIDSLLGHHDWGREDFHPFRHNSAPRLTAMLIPLIDALRRNFGLPACYV